MRLGVIGVIGVLAGVIIASGLTGVKAEELKAIDVQPTSDLSYTIYYNDGTFKEVVCESELECAEEYSNVWYEIYE